MNTKLAQAVEAVERLPQPKQDALAEALLETATRGLVDDAIARGEESYAKDGGRPIDDVFGELISKYDV